MKEPEHHFSPESIDQQTERFFGQLPAGDSRLIADLYQTFTPVAEEYSRSLQRIWRRFAQAQEQLMPLEESQRGLGNTHLPREGTRDVKGHTHAPVPGSFQQSPQPLPRGSRRSRWKRFSSGVSIAIVLLIVLSWVLLSRTFHQVGPQTALGASLTLDGSPQFNQNIVFLVKSSEGGQYLASISFDTYDGHTWRNTAVSRSQLPAKKRTVSEGSPVHLVTQQITVVNPPGELQPYLFSAGQIASVDQPTTLLIDKTTGSLVAVLDNNGQPLAAGDQYSVQSYVSSATIATLRSIPLPADAPKLPPNYDGPLPSTYYNPAILSAYLQLPNNLDPNIKILAKNLTSKAPTMYDKAVALESYFHNHYVYDANISLPPGQEAVSWFLFRSDHKGFCNYYATAMAILARELGMPARVVEGYTNGKYDVKHNQWVVYGSDAYTWTQIFFAGYGWINFEPSPSFALFLRPLATNSSKMPTSQP
jgi:Transglutaminase-like superfamily/TgpA N-terminal domain